MTSSMRRFPQSPPGNGSYGGGDVAQDDDGGFRSADYIATRLGESCWVSDDEGSRRTPIRTRSLSFSVGITPGKQYPSRCASLRLLDVVDLISTLRIVLNTWYRACCTFTTRTFHLCTLHLSCLPLLSLLDETRHDLKNAKTASMFWGHCMYADYP